MKTIPIKNGLFLLLIFEVAIISIVTLVFMGSLYKTYTNLVYDESVEVLDLHSIITNTKLSGIENLSFEVLSNQDIQRNLRKYHDSPHSYEIYKALTDLYTQIFTRWIMNKNIVSISFVFPDGRRVDAGRLHLANISGPELDETIRAATRADGSCGWAANAAGRNILTLYRLIKDISGSDKFRPLGTLIINVDGEYFLRHTPDASKRYKPEIVCIADEHIITKSPIHIRPDEIMSSINNYSRYHIVMLNRQPHFVSAKKLGYGNWHLLYILPTRGLLSSIYHLNLVYLIALLLITIAVIAIGYNFANAISKPIASLTNAMKVVEENEYAAVLENPPPEPRLAISEVIQLSSRFSQMVQRIDHLIKEVYLKQLLIMEMKYKVLQQQINPHFLYNTLDTINWKAARSGNKEISVMVKALSKLLRGSIKGPDITTVQEDLGFAEEYIRIQKIRFEERLDFAARIPASALSCRIPRLTLQPIVENCIIHNLEKYAGACRISVTASEKDGRLEIAVEDSGRGADLEHVGMVLCGQVETKNNGIGLKNIDQRIKMAFGEEYGLKVENKEPTGTRVIIALPSERPSDRP